MLNERLGSEVPFRLPLRDGARKTVKVVKVLTYSPGYTLLGDEYFHFNCKPQGIVSLLEEMEIGML
jgi:hypothetical protein